MLPEATNNTAPARSDAPGSLIDTRWARFALAASYIHPSGVDVRATYDACSIPYRSYPQHQLNQLPFIRYITHDDVGLFSPDRVNVGIRGYQRMRVVCAEYGAVGAERIQ